jgi:Cytochrome oxidase complex assembly protein 1
LKAEIDSVFVRSRIASDELRSTSTSTSDAAIAGRANVCFFPSARQTQQYAAVDHRLGARIVTFVFGGMRSSEPYQHALHAATHDPRVLEQLGPPLKPGWLTTGSISLSGSSGEADLTIPLSGSKGQGAIYVRATKSEGEWSYQSLAFRAEGGGERINLLPPSDAGNKEE